MANNVVQFLSQSTIRRNFFQAYGFIENSSTGFEKFSLERNSQPPEISDRSTPPSYNAISWCSVLGENSVLYFWELSKLLEQRIGWKSSLSTICRNMTRYKVTKKRCNVTPETETLNWERTSFKEETGSIEQLIYLDETAIDRRNVDRSRGWAPIGRRLRLRLRHTFRNRGKKYIVVNALSVLGPLGFAVKEGSLDQNQFYFFLKNELFPDMNLFSRTKLGSCSW